MMVIFYRDSVVPVIPTMNGNRSNAKNYKFQVISVGINNRIAIAQLRPIDIGDENEKCRYFLVVYCEDE
jgi:hypothetical protein